LILFVLSIFLANTVSNLFLLFLLAYVAISSLYSAVLKNLPIIDLFCISTGFILRLLAGGEAFDIILSEWLFLSVFLLSLFLSTGKRVYEKILLGEDCGLHRKSLTAYPSGFLDGIMYMTGGAVLVTYTMYVISKHSLVYTVPLCYFGLLRYIFRVKSGLGGDPTESLLKDLPLLLTGITWIVTVALVIYK